MNYTKGEWHISSTTLIIDDNSRIIANLTPITIDKLRVGISEAKANAERIRQCVNNFDDLLEACKKLLKANLYADAEGLVSFDYPNTEEGEEAKKFAEQVILKAEKG